MRLKSLLLGSLLGASVLFGGSASARTDSPQGMQLYVFSSGHLHLDKAIIQNGASGKMDVPVAFFLIKHPKGNVLFDTGNNDRLITDPSYWGPLTQALDPGRTPDVAIDAQLDKIGVKPDDVKYVVLGHFHLDHAGNVSKFPNATLVYQRDEIRAAFWPAPGFAAPYIPGDFSALRAPVGQDMPARQKVIELDGDLDLFGDGSMYIHRAVSHTPGSEILVVRLPKTGTVVLTSDACYLRENLDKNLLPGIGNAYSPPGILDAYNWVRRIMDTENGDVIFAHDPDTFKAHKHAPESYD
jgi:N-acyl homoserine lactone hydrolase